MIKQGTQANVSGNMLEDTVKNIFSKKGFVIAKYSDWEKNPHQFGTELLLINAKFETIYKHKGTTEFLLLSEKFGLRIRIECKWQQVSGSVDEKLPYLYLNCIEAMPEDWIIIIIDGTGWKLGAIEWLKTAIKEKRYTNETNRHKTIKVMSLADFLTWSNQTFKK